MVHIEALNSDVGVYSVGLGTFKFPKKKLKPCLEYAINVGYRHFDCAHLYGNESDIGLVLESLFHSTIDRDEVFITSKPGNDLMPMDSEGNMLIDDVPVVETWMAMEELVDKDLVKAIGLSNFNKRQIETIMDCCRIKPSMLQIESHLDFLNQELIDYAKSINLVVTAYSPLGSPGFAKKFENLTERVLVKEIAERHNKTPAQILLKHVLQRGAIVIPKTSNFERMKENFSIFDFTLSNEEMRILSETSAKIRRVDPKSSRMHPEYPFNDFF